MFQTTQVIHVKRKREDAPVDSLYLQTSSKRARPNLAPQFYFKRLTTTSSLRGSSRGPLARQQSSLAQNGSASSSDQPISLNEADEQALIEARLLAPPSSLLHRDDGLSSAFSQYGEGTRGAHGDERPPLILDEDGCPAILSGPPEEQLRDPYALRQRERVAQEARGREEVIKRRKRRVVVQRRIGGDKGDNGGDAAEGQAVFSIARGDALGGDDMDLDHNSGGMAANGVNEESEFVYDVFVPEAMTSAKSATISTGSNVWATAQPSGLAGTVLVNEDDADWIGDYFYEGNADDEDSDRVYSDDEDSNAEDYYGADYPEDEDEDYNEDDTDEESD